VTFEPETLESRSRLKRLGLESSFHWKLQWNTWALGQATWAKMTLKLVHLWRQSQTIRTPQPKIFFECNLLDCPIRLSRWTALYCNRRRS